MGTRLSSRQVSLRPVHPVSHLLSGWSFHRLWKPLVLPASICLHGKEYFYKLIKTLRSVLYYSLQAVSPVISGGGLVIWRHPRHTLVPEKKINKTFHLSWLVMHWSSSWFTMSLDMLFNIKLTVNPFRTVFTLFLEICTRIARAAWTNKCYQHNYRYFPWIKILGYYDKRLVVKNRAIIGIISEI